MGMSAMNNHFTNGGSNIMGGLARAELERVQERALDRFNEESKTPILLTDTPANPDKVRDLEQRQKKADTVTFQDRPVAKHGRPAPGPQVAQPFRREPRRAPAVSTNRKRVMQLGKKIVNPRRSRRWRCRCEPPVAASCFGCCGNAPQRKCAFCRAKSRSVKGRSSTPAPSKGKKRKKGGKKKRNR